MIVFAVDPGSKQQKGTLDVRGTGWAALGVHAVRPPELLATGLLPGGTDALLAALQDTERAAGAWFHQAEQVVVENFILREARASIEPLEMAGLVRGLCAALGKPCVKQNPDQRTIVSHDDLKRVGMWPGGAGHADEAQAVRHGLTWAMIDGNLPTISLLSPDPDDGATDDEDDAPRGPSAW